MSNTDDKKKKVKIFHRLNKLKAKTGIPLGIKIPGYIDPDSVKKAQAPIDDKKDDCLEQFEILLGKHAKAWEKLKGASTEKQHELLEEAHNYANNIKDLAETYEYEALQQFSTVLRDFYEKIDIENDEHHSIVEKHIDAMHDIALKIQKKQNS